MVSRDDLLNAIIHEIDVCKHLATKVPKGGMDYRPTEMQRSTAELLRYLAMCGSQSIVSLKEGDWSHYGEEANGLDTMDPDQFGDVMDEQVKKIKEAFNDISDDDLANKKVTIPTGQEVPLGAAIMRTAYAWLVAYRMQLFFNTKIAGAHHLNTIDCWAGVDPEPVNNPAFAEANNESNES